VNLIGNILKIIGFIVYFLASLVGFVLCLKLLFNVVGLFWTIIFGIFIPITYFVVPWYSFFELGDATLLVINYGGWILATIIYFLGAWFSGED